MSLQEPITMKKLNKFTPPNTATIDSKDIKRLKKFLSECLESGC